MIVRKVLLAEREGFARDVFTQPTVTSTDSENTLYLCGLQALSRLQVRCLRRPLTTSVDHSFDIKRYHPPRMVENVDLSGCNLAPRAFSKISHKKAELALATTYRLR